MKILIRNTLIQQPHLTWDEPIEEQVVTKMELAIKLYFVLTKEVVENRVSLKTQNIFLRPGDLIPTVFRYEVTKKPISNV